jgi:sarcosine oxidase delta subunit
MDIWGHCTTCERWFSMAGGTARCPVCFVEPARIADRDEDAAAAGMA